VDKSIIKALDKEVSLFLVDAARYQSVIVNILKIMVTKKKLKGLYIALNKPHKTLMESLGAEGIDTNKLFFFDGVSKETQKESNVTRVAPGNLSGVSIKIKKKFKEDYAFIIFDTVDSFLSYNKKESLEKFFISLISTLRDLNKKAILIGVKDTLVEHKLHIPLEKVSDEIIDLAPMTAAEKFEDTFSRL